MAWHFILRAFLLNDKNGVEYLHGVTDIFIGKLGVLILRLNTGYVNIILKSRLQFITGFENDGLYVCKVKITGFVVN